MPHEKFGKKNTEQNLTPKKMNGKKKSFLNTALLILKNSKRSVFCRQLKQITVEKKN